ncbi:hypothetical protein [Halococcus sp. IIIV-5B]|uniref:hypothetical protein n=1 Tax=Halococcus sp. IIIV-5B TaxID=2321230 RepID=UPI0011C48019|nr:hypothetical protein [Halococcus sp. IIIV-5B]
MGQRQNNRSRRAFLKVAGVSVGYGTLGTTVAQSNDTTVTIPITENQYGEHEYTEEVPREWLEQVESAKKVASEIEVGENGVIGAEVVNSDRQIGGKRAVQVRQAVDPEIYTGSFTIQEEADVDIETVPAEEPELLGCYNSGRYSTIQGGMLESDTKVNGGRISRSIGSTGARVHSSSGTYMLSVAHVWSACAGGALGSKAYQPLPSVEETDNLSRFEFGELAVVDVQFDFTLISPTTSRNIGGNIRGAGPVAGWITEAGLGSLMTDNETVQKEGATTGRTSGKIVSAYTKSDGKGCITFGNAKGVTTSVRGAQGDSGSVVFWKGDNGKLYVVHLVSLGDRERQPISNCFGGNAKSNHFNRSAGTSGYQIHRMGYDFG